MTKREVYHAALRGDGCLGNSADEEPVFVLCARDPGASEMVRLWAENAQHMGVPLEKVLEALEVVNAMDAWRAAHGGGKVPD
jgi:hypothetical protein